MKAFDSFLRHFKGTLYPLRFKTTAWTKKTNAFSARSLKRKEEMQSRSALRARYKKFIAALRETIEPIHHTLGPLALRGQTLRSIGRLLQPWRYRQGPAREALRALLEKEYGMRCSLFSSGRESLLAILKTFDLRPGEEVILQSYTCGVLANAIHAAGGVPIYVDTGPGSLNIDPRRIEEAMSPRVRAVICQHTFGVSADLTSLREICDRNGCALIEDCAHVIPSPTIFERPKGASRSVLGRPLDSPSPSSGSLEESDVGRVGDFILLSFGRDKVISGITGGAVLTPHAFSHRELWSLERAASELPLFTIARLLLYPLIMWIARPLYGLKLGKAFLAGMRVCRILLPVITDAEKQGQLSPQLRKLPDACAALVLHQFRLLPQLQHHRSALVTLYRTAFSSGSWRLPALPDDPSPLIRFPLLLNPEDPRTQQSLFSSGPDVLREELAKLNIYLSDGWHSAVVLPASFDQERTGYRPGSCPNAELLARSILNLPTHPMMSRRQAQRLIHVLREKLTPASPEIIPAGVVQELKRTKRNSTPAYSLH